MVHPFAVSYTGSEDADVCQNLGQLFSFPATILWGRTVRIIDKRHLKEESYSIAVKVVAITLSLFFAPLSFCTTLFGLLLNSCSVTYKRDAKLANSLEKLGTGYLRREGTPRARTHSHETPKGWCLASETAALHRRFDHLAPPRQPRCATPRARAGSSQETPSRGLHSNDDPFACATPHAELTTDTTAFPDRYNPRRYH